MEVPQCPVKDCNILVDLILQSSSGDQFGAHKHNLQTYGDGFPLSDSIVTDIANDVPILSESTEVVRLMLRFMHRGRQPDLLRLPFDTVARFADAAEKYFIDSATGTQGPGSPC
ncbi:hypothetical protein D9619_007917 [Psilocybe cf. subviscida]|uniref:BTB domain-containing protein n=1 Tax=Psilocybe cf. subviscida TaxID=2480587 RepID=A0A8H5ATV5_9AGAR|nr:hypothetical protein D9619_007917 [Psilocybe cf. subviscida]